MDTTDLQQQLFTIIKKKLPVNVSLVDELSDVLNIGSDSVYRRIRGEKEITLTELKLLCEKYSISLDLLLQLKSDSVIFSSPELNVDHLPFDRYLTGILQQLKYFNSFKNRKLMYLSKDAPVFHFYIFPEIAAFKSFFWAKTIMNQEGFHHRKFSLADSDGMESYQTGLKIIKEYSEIPSVELWNHESINSTISQIEFYRDAGIFSDKSDLIAVLDSLIKMLDHLQLQAEKGYKFLPGLKEVAFRAPIELYLNEVVIGSNTIHTQLDDLRLTFVSYNVLHYMHTADPRFTKKAFANFEMLTNRSTLISGTGEKDRNKFFQILRDKVEACRP
jgi:hypothetical protein